MSDSLFLNQRSTDYQKLFDRDYSDEEMVRDWTISESDIWLVNSFNINSRLFVALQLCVIRISGRFTNDFENLSPRIINYLNKQLKLPPSLKLNKPSRKATVTRQRKKILNHLGFRKYDETAQKQLTRWIKKRALKGKLPDELFVEAENFLLFQNVIKPGFSTLERLINKVCSQVHDSLYTNIYDSLPIPLKTSIDDLLTVEPGEQKSLFYRLKQYPPSATIKSINSFLARYKILDDTGINDFKGIVFDQKFTTYLYEVAKRYSANDILKLKLKKKYAMMVCFLFEARKALLDNLIKMHDQFVMDLIRKSKRKYEAEFRHFRKRQKKAIDTVLDVSELVLDWPTDKPITKESIWECISERKLLDSLSDLQHLKQLEEHGYANKLISNYGAFRKYFKNFIKLPFNSKLGSEYLIDAIEIVRQVDKGEINELPSNSPTNFIPRELRLSIKDKDGKLKRNAWELSLAIAMKDAFRSGDLFLPNSKQHVSFENLLINQQEWEETIDDTFEELNLPTQEHIRSKLFDDFEGSLNESLKNYKEDDFATIKNGKLHLKRYDKAKIPQNVNRIQKAIDMSMPSIRIEQLLIEVDKDTNFTKHFRPLQKHHSRPKSFYKTLIASIICQATNLGVVSMSSSVNDLSVDMIRYVLQNYVQEESIKAASAEIVNQHHLLPFSEIHGSGTLSSSDAQRFKVRADSLISSYYPRYFGYYEKAIGIYSHASDKLSVYGTQIISCSPREAPYVIDGLLENNTILKIREHTTDTHGYTEIIFALCYLLGFYFMPRIRDLKDQQLYRVDPDMKHGDFASLLNKTAKVDIIEEQWNSMAHVSKSLIERTAPAHVIVQRLMNGSPSDRLSKAFRNLGRIIKTQYILRYITDKDLRRRVQLQLNKGEYRHKLPRWIFFANQGEFTVGDYEEMMNKASCLSLVSNAILYWNTKKISDIVDKLREQGEIIDDETLKHISLLPFKHVLPNGTYFIDDI